jgi:acetoin utilization protein AcuB
MTTPAPTTTKPIPTVAAYMTEHPYSIGLRESLEEAYARMRRHAIRHLPVLSGKRLVGLVPDPNLQTIELLKRVNLADISVEDAMTPVPHSVTVDARLDEVVREMLANKVDAVVVMRDADVAGVFTAVDGLRALYDLLGGNGSKT